MFPRKTFSLIAHHEDSESSRRPTAQRHRVAPAAVVATGDGGVGIGSDEAVGLAPVTDRLTRLEPTPSAPQQIFAGRVDRSAVSVRGKTRKRTLAVHPDPLVDQHRQQQHSAVHLRFPQLKGLALGVAFSKLLY